ncbi:MAG: biotin/lipoyl-containing protein, partial [Haliea sp.]
MAKKQVTVPDIGGAEGAEVIELLVAVGEEIELEQGLLVLESDKASMEIPSDVAGKVLQVLVQVGDELAEGEPILVVETADEEAEQPEESKESGESGESAEPPKQPAPDAADKNEKQASGADAAGKDASDAADATGGEVQEITVTVPDIGTDDDVDLIEFSVKVGDEVAEGDSLVVLESDKASMEVPSPHAGKVLKWLVKEGSA